MSTQKGNPRDFFTQFAIQLINRAREAAARHSHLDTLQTEHLLLSLIAEPESVGAKVLQMLEVDLHELREVILERYLAQIREITGKEIISLTPRTQRVIEFAFKEARERNHYLIGTIHLLLGLLREAEGMAALILNSKNVRIENVREKLHLLLYQEGEEILLEGTVLTPVSLSVEELERLIGHE